MRVLMLTSSYPLEPRDYRGGFVRDLGTILMGAGMDVEVAVPRPRGGPSSPQEDQSGPRILWLPSLLPGRARGFHGAGLETNLTRDPLALLAIPPFLMSYTMEVVVRALFADCILAHWLLPMGAVGAVVARITGKPLVVVAHSGPPPAARLPPMKQMVRYTVRRASWVTCVSESVRREVLEVSGEGLENRVITLPMGVDLRPSIAPSKGRDPVLRLLFAGRLVRIKGVDVLLNALLGIDGVRLTVLGDGPEIAQVRRKDLCPVRMEGPVSPEDVRGAMQTHDALVVPSREGWFGRVEGLPRVLMEAWSCGLPVLAAATGGLSEAIREHGGGLLFRPGDARDLRRVIGDFRDDAALRSRLREEALAAAAGLSWQKVGPRWTELIGRFE